MKTLVLVTLLLFTTGCTLHHKSTLTPTQITQKVDRFMDEVYVFARNSEKYALEHGRKLTDAEKAYATSIGIKEPQKVRVVMTSDFPVPKNKEVLKGFKELGYDSPLIVGVTYGHGIYIKSSWLYDENAILAHELMHVRQVEKAKSYRAFLRKYLMQAYRYEYFKMPYEHEAFELTKDFKSF